MRQAYTRAHTLGRPSLRGLIWALRELLCPTDSSLENDVAGRFFELLVSAQTRTINPSRWIDDFIDTVNRALAYDLPCVKGEHAIKQFLLAVKHQIDPGWTEDKLKELKKQSVLQGRLLTLLEYALLVKDNVHDPSPRMSARGRPGAAGSYATAAPSNHQQSRGQRSGNTYVYVCIYFFDHYLPYLGTRVVPTATAGNRLPRTLHGENLFLFLGKPRACLVPAGPAGPREVGS